MLEALFLVFALNEPQAILRERFEREVREIASAVDGVLGVTIVDPKSGDRISVNGGVVFTQASAIKLPVLVELMRQAEAGEQNLDEAVTMKASDVVP
jgi:beta-lactamase class A